jgi:hypothetical protein
LACAQSGEAQNASKDLTLMAVTSRNCDVVPSSGPGSQAAPIPVQLGALGDKNTLDCKWIETTAVLSWTEYWHYRADAYADDDALYYAKHRYRLLVENFAGQEARMNALHHAQVRLSALYADLCDFDPGEDVFVYGGPCHYGRAGLLKNVRIESVLKPPFRRLHQVAGEPRSSRLAKTPARWSERPAIEAAFRRWAGAALAGPPALTAHDFGSDEGGDDAGALDPDGWMAFVSGAESPLRALPADTSKWRIAIYRAVGDKSQTLDRATACVCLIGDCGRKRPLVSEDADHMAKDYLCAEADKDQGHWQVRS